MPRIRQMVCQNTLLDCQLLEYNLRSNPSQNCILVFIMVGDAVFGKSAYEECKEDLGLLWCHAFQTYLFARIAFCKSWFHYGVRYFAIVRQAESFPLTYASSRWSYSCFKQLPLHPRLRYAFRELWEQQRYLLSCWFRNVTPLSMDLPYKTFIHNIPFSMQSMSYVWKPSVFKIHFKEKHTVSQEYTFTFQEMCISQVYFERCRKLWIKIKFLI